MQAFANGGVVGGPTVFPMRDGRTGLMGEAGPEAIMPLRRTSSGRLGVEVAGGAGGGSTQVNVTVNADGSSQSSGPDDMAQLGKRIGDAVRGILVQEQRPGGLLAA